jgi:hypothetical protein
VALSRLPFIERALVEKQSWVIPKMKLVKSLEVLLRGVRARALQLLWRKPKTRGNTHNTRGRGSLPLHRRATTASFLSLSAKLSIYSKWRRPFANNIILLLLPTAALLLLALAVYMCVSKSMHMTHPSHIASRAPRAQKHKKGC